MCCQHHLPRMHKRAGGGLFLLFRPYFTTTTSLVRKSEPEVVFSRFDCMSPTPPPSHAKASRRWFSFHVSTTCRQHHLPRTQKRAGGGFLFTFRQRVANTTSLAHKSEPEVVLFSRFDNVSPIPPLSNPRHTRTRSMG